MRNTDSPRWCDLCQDYGEHHTDRHTDYTAVGRVGVAAADASLACTVRHETTDEQTVWYGTCPNCALKPRFASLVAFEAWATHHGCNITTKGKP